MEITFSLEEINNVANELLAQNLEKVILFNGEMGAGKTTFIKALSKALGVQNATSSPTFSLVNEYETTDGQVLYHFDVYRIKNEIEALYMGIDEYLHSGNYCFIEWAEKIESLLPQNHSIIHLSVLPNGKRILSLL
jgi:tRNA threonylcarbamoyladenosine biosynthesis protein TsaE